MNISLPESITKEQQEIIDALQNGELPKIFPATWPIDRISTKTEDIGNAIGRTMQSLMLKDMINNLGMWGYISQKGANWLVERFPNKTWIDPFAGRGWFAKALRESGAKVIAGDIEPGKPVTEVIESEASDLIKDYGHTADILLLSWTQNLNDSDAKAALSFGKNKDVILYGHPGVCFSQNLLDIFHLDEFLIDFPDSIAKPMEKQIIALGKVKPTTG